MAVISALTSVHARTTHGLAGLRAAAGDLDTLALRCGAPASMYSAALLGWFEARPDWAPVLVRLEDSGGLRAAAVLAGRRQRGVWRLSRSGTPGEPYAFLLDAPDLAEPLATALHAALLRSPGRWWKLLLADLPAPDPVTDALARRLPAVDRAVFEDGPELVFEPGRSGNHYLSRNTRAAAAKARNRIAKAGHRLELVWLQEPAAVRDELADISRIRSERNCQLQRGAEDPAELTTFGETIRRQAEAGRVRLLLARIDGAVAAYAVCFFAGSSLWVYSNNVNPEFTRFSAGTIANAEVVRYAQAEPGIVVLRWGRGLQRYKLSGPVRLARSQSLTAWSSPSTRWLLHAGRTLRRALHR